MPVNFVLLLRSQELLARVRELENDVEKLKKLKSHSDKASDGNSSGEKRHIDFSKFVGCRLSKPAFFLEIIHLSFRVHRYRKRHIALKFLYLGWNYDGYVVQDHTVNSIEDHLFKALTKGRLIEDRASSNYHRCGRTDQGVSSFCQVRQILRLYRFFQRCPF